MKAIEEQQHVDWLRNLPEGLLFEILLKLATKDVVKCSVLSSWWRNLWKLVPGLDLDFGDFPEHVAFASFIDRFLLGLNSESRLQHFKLTYQPEEEDEDDIARLTRWTSTAIERKVQHLHVWYTIGLGRHFEVELPQSVYTCESLVSLNLRGVSLANPKFVSLPCVKIIALDWPLFPTYLSLGMLISGCPLLKSLTLTSSTLSSYYSNGPDGLVFAIDAPRLEYLKIRDSFAQSFVICSPGSLVEADINIAFNTLCKNRLDPDNLPMRSMIRSFLMGISSVKVMKIHTSSLKAIYYNSRRQRLPLFPNLTSLRADFDGKVWEMLPIFLESCPNLKHLSLVPEIIEKEIINVPGPRCLLPSLEFVEIKEEEPLRERAEARQMELVSYFLEKSTILKKLTLSLRPNRKKKASAILNKFLTIPTLSPSCQVVVL